jgi:hypothetical protein
MNQFDYCDTYDAYYSGLNLDNRNKVKTFLCNMCNQSKFILKKNVGDSDFKCEECIDASLNQQQEQEQEQVSQQNQITQETNWRWFSFF